MQPKTTPSKALAVVFSLLATASWGQTPSPVRDAPSAQAQPQPQPSQQAGPQAPFPQQRLDQMVAPIALYPDQLVTNVLMASTYPLEVVEASRWLHDPTNAALKGDALLDAMRAQPWDPSVKFLLPFPQIVAQMNDHLDWTHDLGTAFTNQQGQVMAEVQHMRQLAMSCGKLHSTPQQVVDRQGGAITIAPAQPSEAYVPVYNPAVAYGGWPYPAYPPVFFAWPPGFLLGGVDIGVGIGFSFGFGIVGPLWGWASPNWGGGVVNVNTTNIARFSNVDRAAADARFAGGTWRHVGDPAQHGAASAALTHHAGSARVAASTHAGGSHAHSYAHAHHYAGGYSHHHVSYAHAHAPGHMAHAAHSGFAGARGAGPRTAGPASHGGAPHGGGHEHGR